MENIVRYKAVVIGASAGGLSALTCLLGKLPADYRLPVIIVQHRMQEKQQLLEEVLQQKCSIKIKQADEKERIKKAVVYLAPPGYHLLVEKDKTFSLSADEQVKFSRPSIDVLFESAAMVYGRLLAGILLTGANSDGAEGLLAIRKNGGTTIAQLPEEAAYSAMPRAAIEKKAAQYIFKLSEIKNFLLKIA